MPGAGRPACSGQHDSNGTRRCRRALPDPKPAAATQRPANLGQLLGAPSGRAGRRGRGLQELAGSCSRKGGAGAALVGELGWGEAGAPWMPGGQPWKGLELISGPKHSRVVDSPAAEATMARRSNPVAARMVAWRWKSEEEEREGRTRG